jgi:subtilisin family serine protease
MPKASRPSKQRQFDRSLVSAILRHAFLRLWGKPTGKSEKHEVIVRLKRMKLGSLLLASIVLIEASGRCGISTLINPERPEQVAGELLLKIEGGPHSAASRQAQALHGYTVRKVYPYIGWQLVKIPVGITVQEAVTEYSQDAAVAAVEPNFLIRPANLAGASSAGTRPTGMRKNGLEPLIPSDPWFSQQWALTNISAELAWSWSSGSTDVVVAVMDTGVNYRHEDLAENMWHNPGEIPGNGIDDDDNGYVDDVFGVDTVAGDGDPDDQGYVGGGTTIYHGTGLASIIGAVGNNGLGGAGVSWQVRLMALRCANTNGSIEYASQLAAYDYVIGMVDKGVPVKALNASFGGGSASTGQAQRDSMIALGAAGVVVVTDAGNGSTDMDATPYYPAAFEYSNVISVAASTSADRLSSLANWGRLNVDLVAPGQDTFMASGPGTGDYSTGTVTSYATPHVAGAIALLAAAFPEATVDQIKAAILETVDTIEPLRGMLVAGGRLNIARALLNLRTNQAPIIIVSPRSQTVQLGDVATLMVGPGGTPPFSYQWYEGQTPLPSATNSWLALTNVSSVRTGLWAQVSNSFGSATSLLSSVSVDSRLSPVVAWGARPHGQCDVPPDLADVIALAAGRWHSLALRSDGTVTGWGGDAHGEDSALPAISGAKAIAAGAGFSLVLLNSGRVIATGDNSFGATNIPPGLSNVVAISAGQYHSLALQGNGKVVAWGLNGNGQCNVPGSLSNVTAIAGGFHHSLALLSNGTIVAWGENTVGQCNVPTSITDAVAVASGALGGLALRANGTVTAWGANTYGQLDIPAGLSNVIAIAGYGHFLALKSDGTVIAWGAGQTDRKTDLHWGQSIVPNGLSNVIAISSNGRHSLALMSRGLPLPQLSITSEGTQLVLSWTSDAGKSQLLSADTLNSPAGWQPWSGTQTTNAGKIRTTVSPTNAHRFFRLRSS